MAAYISFQPSDFFNNLLYTGGSGFTAFTGVGFQPDMTWHKARTSGANWWGQCDSVRGVNTGGKDCVALYSNDASAQGTDTVSYLNGYQSDGFTAGNNGSFGSDGLTYVASCWKAGTTDVPSGGSITPSEVSLNTTTGFGIYKYSGASATSTIAHGLGATPTLIILKSTSHATNWQVGSTAMDSTWNYVLYLNLQHSKQNEIMFGDTAPTSTVFSLGNATESNGSGRDYIAYAWTPIKGYSKFGTYTGNSNADGAFIYTGFRPAFIMVKRYDSGTEDWNVWNNKALGYNVDNNKLLANLTTAESTSDEIDLLSNGFKWRTSQGGLNGSSGSYIYMAFAEFPLVSSNSKAGTAR